MAIVLKIPKVTPEEVERVKLFFCTLLSDFLTAGEVEMVMCSVDDPIPCLNADVEAYALSLAKRLLNANSD